MADTSPKPTKKAFIIRDFNDAGAQTSFTASTDGDAGTMPEIDAGAFANYKAAGLVREADTEAAAAQVAA